MAKRDGFYKRGRIWWVSTDPITGRERSTGCTDLIAAKGWKAERERRKHDPAYARSTTATFGEWARKLTEMKAQKLKPISVQKYGQIFGHWVRLLPESTVLAGIGPGTFDEFISLRRSDKVTDYTIGKELTAMVSLLRFAKRSGCYPGDLEALRPIDFEGKHKKGTRALTPEEFLLLVPQLTAGQLAFVCVCIALGCRRSEAFRVDAITEDASSVHIAGTKTEESDRVVPVLSTFRRLLAPARPHLPLPKAVNWNLNRDLWEACDAAGIARCNCNDLRRTHASWLKEAGVDSDTVRRLLGHTTTELVDTVYGRPRPEKLAELAERAIAQNPQGHDNRALPEPRRSNVPWKKGDDSRRLGPSSASGNADDSENHAGILGAGADETGQGRVRTDTTTRQSGDHPPAAWALAAAARQVGVL